MKLDSYKPVYDLCKTMVEISSINRVPSQEDAMADFIYDYYKNHPYFISHPDHLFTIETKKDVVHRKSTLAYLKGNNNNTILLLGHIDTVDIKDYGPLQDIAFNWEKLPEALKNTFHLSDEVRKDMESGDYLFARGALDMKSGVASNMFVFSYFLDHPEELDGSLVLLAECDEEGESLGVISALDELIRLKKEENLNYVACINTDFCTAQSAEDEKRYVHIGTVGKLLPCFAVFGKEAHVGKAFDAFDPNLLLSEITRRISFNMDLSDEGDDSCAVPPISLKQNDNKDSYTVQTALSALGYYNYMIYQSDPHDILMRCKKIAIDSFDAIIELLNRQYEIYCRKNHFTYHPLPWQTSVYTCSEWFDYLQSIQPSFKQDMDEFAEKLNRENPEMDLRLFGYEMIKKSYEYYPKKAPVVILYFGTMYYSSVTCKDTCLIESVQKAIQTIQPESKRNIKLAHYYPYISDMSFLSLNGEEEVIREMLENSPQHGYKYIYPYEKIREINIPVVNIGSYGKDGHTFTERVEKWHSFQNVPNLTYQTIIEYLKTRAK